jgi:beta-lactam-binding protein with PASTA domain
VPPKCVVPKVVGKRLAAAKTKIRKAHCSVGKITHKHVAASKRGKVISESPKPGRRLKNHAKVNLTVGK